jgi:type IV pilus assembly protein PilQ
LRDISTKGYAKLNAAEEKGDISILSRPSVTTLNNQPARIRSGVTFYVKASGDISIGSGTTGTSTSSGLETIESGIELIVTPQITVRDFVKLTIEATESQPDFSRAVEGIPAIIDNTASTTVLLKNQETTIIGGLLQSRKAQQQKGVPWLSKIPLLGWFFRSKTNTNTKSELLVFIKPTILEGTLTEIPSIKEDKESIYYGKKEK